MRKSRLIATLLLTLAATALWGAGIKIDLDGRDEVVTFKDLTATGGIKGETAPWVPEKSRNQYLIFTSKSLPADFADYQISFVPEKSGTVKLYVRGGFVSNKSKVEWSRYRDLKLQGATLLNPGFSEMAGRTARHWEGRAENFLETKDGVINAAHDFGAIQPITVKAGEKVTLNFRAAAGKITAPPAGSASAASSGVRMAAREEKDPSYYRLYQKDVKLLPLADKGIEGKTVREREPELKILRPLPVAKFPAGNPDKVNKLASDLKIPLELFDSANVSREIAIRCGVPFAVGTLFNVPSTLSVIAPDGKAVPAQFSAIGFWPDGSIKWALLQFTAKLKAGEKTIYTVENRPKGGAPYPVKLKIDENADRIKIDTGALQATVDKNKFNLLSNVSINARQVGSFAPEGMTFVDEKGVPFSAAAAKPDKVEWEEKGDGVATLKVSGSYADAQGKKLLQYVSRLRFRAGSPFVEVIHTHIDNNIETEFTDITSLGIRFTPAAKIAKAAVIDGTGKVLASSLPLSVMQQDEQTIAVDGKTSRAAMSGNLEIVGTDGKKIYITVRDAAFRYPKGFTADADGATIELLPKMPAADFGMKLPHYLHFPFCQGFYRMKWGMAFTENFKLDFSAPDARTADAGSNHPAYVVVGRDYFASTRAIDGVTPSDDHSFDDWDKEVAKTLKKHLHRKMELREFGFLNYGDWYGERERNWGNNEYDLAHGLFNHFARTGNLDAARLGEAAAQHQADSDIVHAYPDRYYVGANAQHAIGHTGLSYQVAQRATWSFPCDVSFSAQNGHTWCDGMLEGWYFSGNPVVMDATLKLGEHMLNFMSPSFRSLGTHERSAGWSLKALVALYRATGDPAYLNACRAIVDVTLKEQNFEKGGAWPRPMPTDHANGHKNTFGNCPYLIGILLEGLREYHLVAGNEATKRSIASGATWLKNVYNYEAMHWPYSVGWDGKIYAAGGSALDNMIASGAMTGANFLNDPVLRRISANSLQKSAVQGIPVRGKEFAQAMILTPGLMEELHIWAENHPGERFTSDRIGILREMIKNNRTTSFRLRSPELKTFVVTLLEPTAKLTVDRKPHGARPKAKPTGTLTVTGPDGKTVGEKVFETKPGASFEFDLAGKKGDRFEVKISDDLTAVWNIRRNQAFLAEAQLVNGTTFGGGGPLILSFVVPAGTKSFTAEVYGVHTGNYGAELLDDKEEIRGTAQGTVVGETRLPWLDYSKKEDPKRLITVDFPEKTAKDQLWKLYLWGAGDFGAVFRGIPSQARIE